jgi:hypothetical protein
MRINCSACVTHSSTALAGTTTLLPQRIQDNDLFIIHADRFTERLDHNHMVTGLLVSVLKPFACKAAFDNCMIAF